MIPEHLPSPPAASGLSPCRGRRNAQAWAEVATKQGDTLSRREAAYPSAGMAGPMDGDGGAIRRRLFNRREAAFPTEGPSHA